MMDLQQSSNPTTTNIQVKLEIKTEPGLPDNTMIKNEPGTGIKSEPIDPMSIKKEPKLEPGTIKQEIDVKPITSTNR